MSNRILTITNGHGDYWDLVRDVFAWALTEIRIPSDNKGGEFADFEIPQTAMPRR